MIFVCLFGVAFKKKTFLPSLQTHCLGVYQAWLKKILRSIPGQVVGFYRSAILSSFLAPKSFKKCISDAIRHTHVARVVTKEWSQIKYYQSRSCFLCLHWSQPSQLYVRMPLVSQETIQIELDNSIRKFQAKLSFLPARRFSAHIVSVGSMVCFRKS